MIWGSLLRLLKPPQLMVSFWLVIERTLRSMRMSQAIATHAPRRAAGTIFRGPTPLLPFRLVIRRSVIHQRQGERTRAFAVLAMCVCGQANWVQPEGGCHMKRPMESWSREMYKNLSAKSSTQAQGHAVESFTASQGFWLLPHTLATIYCLYQ